MNEGRRCTTICAVAIASSTCQCGGASDMRPSTAAGESLRDLGLFDDAVAQIPSSRVLPYDVIASLYADEAEKLRFVSIPSASPATYDPTGPWSYPNGTIFIKTFYLFRDARDPSLGRRLLETRIVQREGDLWTGRTYVWNESQTEALRLKEGRTLSVTWIDRDGASRTLDYMVPNENDC